MCLYVVANKSVPSRVRKTGSPRAFWELHERPPTRWILDSKLDAELLVADTAEALADAESLSRPSTVGRE